MIGTRSKGTKEQQQEEQRQYAAFVKKWEVGRPVGRNCVRAFFVGGGVCLFGQVLHYMYMRYFDFTEKDAGDPTVATLIFIAVLLTGLGQYSSLGQWAGAGAGVPVTGFANATAAAALEHRTEGLVLGVGGNMFKLTGSVIVFGVVAAFLMAMIKIILQSLGLVS
ncbi:stage V sporulation protein AC [Numidum massiliense]|uniref:stage V sporulation protein AC n=1 Tax=Numidum massiliense TaxID=1522315 RepID=UPI0006D59828|nr:stage V sporulation protein AC [Numidum massiliense]